MADPINLRLYPVSVLPPSGIIKMKALRKLDEMERELQHLQKGIRQTRAALAQGDGRTLASAVMNSRNWLFSLAESVAYIHAILRSSEGSGSSGTYFVGVLLQRAFTLGEGRGRLDGRA